MYIITSLLQQVVTIWDQLTFIYKIIKYMHSQFLKWTNPIHNILSHFNKNAPKLFSYFFSSSSLNNIKL